MKDSAKVMSIIRWVAALPAGLICALLVQFPIHWAIMAISSSGKVGALGFYAKLPSDVLELFANAFFTPFIIISVGARIVPNYKFYSAIALAILMGVGYGIIFRRVSEDISLGLYTPERWIRLIITLLLCIAGFTSGLVTAKAMEQKSNFGGTIEKTIKG